MSEAPCILSSPGSGATWQTHMAHMLLMGLTVAVVLLLVWLMAQDLVYSHQPLMSQGRHQAKSCSPGPLALLPWQLRPELLTSMHCMITKGSPTLQDAIHASATRHTLPGSDLMLPSACTKYHNAACRRYAVDQLTWLVAETSNTAAPAYLANLQQRIEECDRAGSRNSSLPPGENLGSFADRVGRAGSSADVQTAVSHIP